MSSLEDWTAAVRADLGFDPEPLSAAETRAVLDRARDVAHAVDRPPASGSLRPPYGTGRCRA
jgi:hypothetical protein